MLGVGAGTYNKEISYLSGKTTTDSPPSTILQTTPKRVHGIA